VLKKREEKLAKLKQGPGTFVYDGSAADTEYVPGKALKSKGKIVGWEREPVLKKLPLDVYDLRGYRFPVGEAVYVEDAGLALKMRGMGCFEEIEAEGESAEGEPKKRGKRKKSEPEGESAGA
jgi:hypothetical protein